MRQAAPACANLYVWPGVDDRRDRQMARHEYRARCASGGGDDIGYEGQVVGVLPLEAVEAPPRPQLLTLLCSFAATHEQATTSTKRVSHNRARYATRARAAVRIPRLGRRSDHPPRIHARWHATIRPSLRNLRSQRRNDQPTADARRVCTAPR
jgi:hypothetical protein